MTRRDRPVIFRMSEEEHAEMLEFVRTSEFRSASEFIRLAVVDAMGGSASERVSVAAMRDLERRVEALEELEEPRKPAVAEVRRAASAGELSVVAER